MSSNAEHPDAEQPGYTQSFETVQEAELEYLKKRRSGTCQRG